MIRSKYIDRITDFNQYIDQLYLHKDEILICAAARDTLHNISKEASEKLKKIGMLDLYSAGWKGYLFINDCGKICVNELSEKDKSVSKVIDISNINIKMDSKSLRDGNVAKININGIECCVGWRGLNIVIFNKKEMKIIDSVCFDFWPKTNTPFKRYQGYLNVPLYHSNDTTEIKKEDTISKRKDYFIRRVRSKAVVLVGDDIQSAEYLDKNAINLNIQYVYSVKEFLNEKNEIILGSELFFFILCTDDVGKLGVMKQHLERHGLLYGRDFMRYTQFDMIFSKRKILTIVGFCQLTAISEIFKKIPSITNEYIINHYNYILDYELRFSELIESVKFSDVLVYVNIPFQTNYINCEKLVSIDTKLFKYPDTTFGGLNPGRILPQIKKETGLKKIVPRWAPRPFQYVEPVLDKLIDEGRSNEEIFSMIMGEDFFSEKEVKDNFQLSMSVLKKNEKNSDLVISDFIMDNCTKVPLYRDCLHYTNTLYYEVARRIACTLELCKKEDIDSEEANNKEIYFDTTEHPIYPSVAKALNIEYATTDHLYRVRNGDDQETILMGIREWIYNYCDFTRALNTLERLKVIDRFRKSHFV